MVKKRRKVFHDAWILHEAHIQYAKMKTCWDTAMLIHVCVFCDCFQAAKEELISCDKDYLATSSENSDIWKLNCSANTISDFWYNKRILLILRIRSDRTFPTQIEQSLSAICNKILKSNMQKQFACHLLIPIHQSGRLFQTL